MYLLAKFGGHRSYRNGDINSYINSYMDTLEKNDLTVSIRHILQDFQNQEFQFTISKSQIRLARKREGKEEEEHKHNEQSTLHCTQMQ